MKRPGLIGYSNPSESLNLLIQFSRAKSGAHSHLYRPETIFIKMFTVTDSGFAG